MCITCEMHIVVYACSICMSTCNCECIYHVIRQARLLHHHLNVMYIIPSVLFHFLPYWSTENHKYHCTVSLTSINKNHKKSVGETIILCCYVGNHQWRCAVYVHCLIPSFA